MSGKKSKIRCTELTHHFAYQNPKFQSIEECTDEIKVNDLLDIWKIQETDLSKLTLSFLLENWIRIVQDKRELFTKNCVCAGDYGHLFISNAKSKFINDMDKKLQNDLGNILATKWIDWKFELRKKINHENHSLVKSLLTSAILLARMFFTEKADQTVWFSIFLSDFDTLIYAWSDDEHTMNLLDFMTYDYLVTFLHLLEQSEASASILNNVNMILASNLNIYMV